MLDALFPYGKVFRATVASSSPSINLNTHHNWNLQAFLNFLGKDNDAHFLQKRWLIPCIDDKETLVIYLVSVLVAGNYGGDTYLLCDVEEEAEHVRWERVVAEEFEVIILFYLNRFWC